MSSFSRLPLKLFDDAFDVGDTVITDCPDGLVPAEQHAKHGFVGERL